ncbi:unnamed protein product, partial [Didymodactylos carnosus]
MAFHNRRIPEWLIYNMTTFSDNHSQPPLFSKVIGVRLLSNSKADEKARNIRITVEFQSVSSLPSSHHSKELIIKLTDEQDPFFLYKLHLNEEDFQNLKIEQGLLVDFSAFPQHVIDYLETCVRDKPNEATAKFQLQLVTKDPFSYDNNDQTHLKVVEISSFKHLTHLSLLVTRANDKEIKTYLARRLQLRNEDYDRMCNEYNYIKRELENTQQLLNEKSIEFEKLKLEWNSNNNHIIGKHMQELAEEKQKSLQERTSLQQKLDNERRDLEQTHLRNIKQLQDNLNELQDSTKDLTSLKYRNEITINELSSKLKTTSEEYQNTKDELIRFRKTNTTLENDVHQYEKTVNHLRTKIALVEQDLKNKQDILQQTQDRISVEQESKKKHEENVQSKLEKIKELKQDLLKGNEIIIKFRNELEKYKNDLQTCQTELIKCKDKMKTKDQIATKQERLLQEKEREMANIQKELNESNSKVEKANETNQKLNEQLIEAKDLLKKNELLLTYLNKQITEQNIHPSRINNSSTLDSSLATNHFRPNTFLTNTMNGNDQSHTRHITPYGSLQAHYMPPQSHVPTSLNGNGYMRMNTSQIPTSSNVSNNNTTNSMINKNQTIPPSQNGLTSTMNNDSDSATNTELRTKDKEHARIDPKYFQFGNSSTITSGNVLKS